jgi:hypothetical protein
MNKERLHGFIVSSNPFKKHGVIEGDDGKMYFYFESETKAESFDFTQCYGVAVTFTAAPSKKKIAGLLLRARNIERDLVYPEAKRKQRQERMVERERGTSRKEEVLRQRYGANYIPLGQRRSMWSAENSTVLVAGE